jgi:REP element-mobilizing transposase RayT
MPHWQPEGAALFITWRLYGSLPRTSTDRVSICRKIIRRKLRAWALMVNHVHILIYPEADLSKITKSIKNFSARQANAILGLTGQPFWQEESYDHWVRGPEELKKSSAISRKIRYRPDWSAEYKIGDGPVRGGQARRPVLLQPEPHHRLQMVGLRE